MIKQIVRNIASNYASFFFAILSALLLTPLILSKLGPEALGLWVLTNAVAGYFGLTDLGITSAAIKYISHYRATQQWDELNKTISTSLSCFCVLALLVLTAGILIGQFAPVFFHMPDALIATTRTLMLIMGVVAAIGFANVIPIQCAIAAQRQDLLNTGMIVVQIVAACLSLIVVYFGSGIVALGCIQIFSTICNGLIGIALARKYLPEARFQIRWHKDFGFLIASFAGFALLMSLSAKIIYCTDTIVIARCLNVAAVAGYAIALKFNDLMRGMASCGTGVLGTFVCEAAAQERNDSLGTMWMEGTKWALVMTLPVCVLCVLSGSDLITSWLGRNYPEAVLALAVLAIGGMFESAQMSGYQILVNGGKIKLCCLVMCVEAILNLSISLLLIKSLGVVGVAIGTTIPQILRSGILYPLLLSKFTGVGLDRYFKKAILPAVQAAAVSLLLIAIYRFCGLHSGRLSLLALGLLIAPCELAGMYFFCLTSAQRIQVRQKLLHFSSKKLAGQAVSFFSS